MNYRIRSLFAAPILAIALAACATAVGSPQPSTQAPTPAATPSEEPSEQPSEAPADEERDVAGVITVYPGAVSGPGGTIQEALDNGPTGDDMPVLVNGVLFRDAGGRIYLATAVSDEATPTFDAPMLEVIGLDSDSPEFDMANAERLGLQEANGIVFKTDSQILGTLEVN